ncbi:2Fe-2S iron-sulfur cluster binding domain-containing protein [Pseudorhodoferax sp.]|uniref:2Fe-2S iron-sulfur cluster binding domain-containing protein n=1 Tax=Pseudorhodoferax sp. TaxID=1993553 RepID=UPI002DD67905|nr:2Fe-2S iron-sulfur cluster binding domain-containing protein [Pseudorhodoferax sp.]
MPPVAVTLLFADGVASRIDAEPGSTVVAAAALAGLTLLTDCSNGRCGTCTARLCSGAVELEGYDPAVLPDEDRADGAILPCVARVTGPCVVELPYDHAEASGEEALPMHCRVLAVEAVAEEAVRLVLEAPHPVAFEPGQYLRIRVPGTEHWRSYSMANGSGTSRLEFFVRTVPGGVFSEWLRHQAAPDDILEASAPRGSFFLRDEARPRLFVAGGTGLAPFLSMLRRIEAEPALQRQPTTLLVGARSPRHLIAQAELDALRASVPGLQVRQAAEADAGSALHAGYATELIATLGLAVDTRVYLCGPPPMVDAGRSAAAAAGLARGDVLCERFA